MPAFVLFFASLLLIAPSSVRAEEAPSGRSFAKRVGGYLSQVQVAYFGWSYGPSVVSPTAQTPRFGGVDRPAIDVVTEPQVTLPGVGSMRFLVLPRFSVRPMAQQSQFRMLNTGVGMQGTLYDSGGLSLWSRFEVMLPVMASSQQAGMIAGPQSVQVLAYRGEGSRFTYRFVLVPGANFFSDGTSDSWLYVSPQLWYHVNAKTKVTALVEAVGFRGPGQNWLSYQLRPGSPVHLGLGVRHDFNDRFFLQPFLNFLPQAPVGDWANTAHLALFFGGQFI